MHLKVQCTKVCEKARLDATTFSDQPAPVGVANRNRAAARCNRLTVYCTSTDERNRRSVSLNSKPTMAPQAVVAKDGPTRANQIDSMVRQATLTNAGALLVGATAVTALYTFIVGVVAQVLGSSVTRRADRAFSLDYSFPYPAENTTLQRLSTIDSSGIDSGIAAAQMAVGALSLVVLTVALVGFVVSCGMVAVDWHYTRASGGCCPDTRFWGRHAAMTALLALVCTAVLCEAYFQFQPPRASGSWLGGGPTIISMTTRTDQFWLASRWLGSSGWSSSWRMEDAFLLERATAGSMGRPWTSAVVVALAMVVALIIGSTTAPNPSQEYKLKSSRALCIASAAIASGITSSLASGSLGLVRVEAF